MLRWYYWASIFFILQGIQALDILDRVIYGQWEGKPGDKLTQSLNLLLILVSLALFGRGFLLLRRLRTGTMLSIGLAGFLLLSTLWSVDPQDTATRAVLYLFVVIGAIGIASNLDGDEFMSLLALTCFLSGAASLVLLAVSPANAQVITADSVDFRGIFSQKNVLGEAMVVGALASLHGL